MGCEERNSMKNKLIAFDVTKALETSVGGRVEGIGLNNLTAKDQLRQAGVPITPMVLEKISDLSEIKEFFASSILGRRLILTPEEALRGMPPIGSFIKLSGGRFLMGSTSFADAKPVHAVELSPFLLSAHPVTNQEFRGFIEDGGYRNNGLWSEEGRAWLESKGFTEPRFWQEPRFNRPKQPVVGVSWYEANAYSRWANGRLPTEAEIEYAARGGLVGKKYPWGDADPFGNAHYGQDAPSGAPFEVDQVGFNPNNFGLRHMAGNVWEWGADWYAGDYGKSEVLTRDPKGSATGRTRVLRGGSCISIFDDFLRADFRNGGNPGNRLNDTGFRLARDL